MLFGADEVGMEVGAEGSEMAGCSWATCGCSGAGTMGYWKAGTRGRVLVENGSEIGDIIICCSMKGVIVDGYGM